MDSTINNYRVKKFGKKYFVTTDHGSFIVLSDDEFRKLKQNRMDEELKQKLEEREIILNDSNMGEAIRLLRNRNSYIFDGTSLHIIVVTLRCNMKCIYCHASSEDVKKKGFDMNRKTAKKTVDFIFQTPNNNITIEFQGGEPLLNWNVVKYIVEYAKAKKKDAKKYVKLTVVTNLTEMDNEKMEFLIENQVDVCTSLDGPKDLHDHNRKFIGGSNYDTVVGWIGKFGEEYKKRKIKNREINALVTLTAKSLQYPKEIVDEYVKFGLKNIHLRFLNHLGVAMKTWPGINYDVKKYISFWKKAVEYIEKLQKKSININERMVNLLYNKIANEHDPNYLDLRSPCGAAIGQLTYNYDGNIYTCDEGRMIGEDLFMLGNVKKDCYKDVVTCEKACATVAASINDQYVCNDCVYKPYCGICPVCNYVDQGSVIGKISETDRCKIFMQQFDWVVREKFINIKNKIK